MARQAKAYQRLPGRGTRRTGGLALAVVGTRCALWLGSDHLLAVDTQGFREEYKRFYYRDIQAVVVRKTRTALATTGILTGLLAALAGLALLFGPATWVGFGTAAGALLLVLLIHLARGPSCAARLHTAVHAEELPSLKRWRLANKVIARLLPRIEQAQGTVTPEMLAAELPPPGPGGAAAPIPTRLPVPVRHESGRVHRLLFGLLVADAVVTAADYLSTEVAATLLGMPVSVGVGITAILALVRQQSSDLPAGLRRLAAAALGYFFLNLVVGYAMMISLAVTTGAGRNQAELIKTLAAIEPGRSALLSTCYAGLIAGALVLGVWGLLLARLRRPAPAPAATGGPTP